MRSKELLKVERKNNESPLNINCFAIMTLGSNKKIELMKLKRKPYPKIKFPLIESFLITPREGSGGSVGICTNTTSPGQILNEINTELRKNVSVLGSLIVNRDGAERLIVNSLVHPTMNYLILFSEESSTFFPSTNLLLAIQNGLKDKGQIVGGLGSAAYYPNISKNIFNLFRDNIIILPLFVSRNKDSRKVVDKYLKWLEPKVNKEIYYFLKERNVGCKIYYDSLNRLLSLIDNQPKNAKKASILNPKDFQHLQPPIIPVVGKKTKPKVNFRVSVEQGRIRIDFNSGRGGFSVRGEDEFLVEYTLMKFLGENKNRFSPLEQLLLGAEIGRVQTEIKNNIKFPSFVRSPVIKNKKNIGLETKVILAPDKEYYYRIDIKKKLVSVSCLAFDLCRETFDLRSKGLFGLLEKIAEENRFQKYPMDILHRMDIGAQTARAVIALKSGGSFIQDFHYIFKENKKNLPFIFIEGDSFLDVHKNVLRHIYIAGITEEHADKHKGSARTAAVLAVYRNAKKALASMPVIYKQGEAETKDLRSLYKKQLLSFRQEGSYGYGERTRSHFGFDQLKGVALSLKKNPSQAAVVQRFDFLNDMDRYTDPKTREVKYTHDPCLTHDIYFIKNRRLHSFHIARVQNAVNAYPENIFGLYDAYISKIKKELRLASGDMYILSSRANILLLTEDQRTKQILAEPSRPSGRTDAVSGPYWIRGETIKPLEAGVACFRSKLTKIETRPKSAILDHLENFKGANLIDKAADYLAERGVSHNNPILGQYQPGAMSNQGDYLLFFQANIFGGRLYANAVFVNHSLGEINKDRQVFGYLADRYCKKIKCRLGDLNIFYVNA